MTSRESGEDRIMKCFITCNLGQVYQNYKFKEYDVGGACSTNGEKGKAYRLLVANPEGRRSLGRPRRRWVNNISFRDTMMCGLD
jgi:hypothetical protein